MANSKCELCDYEAEEDWSLGCHVVEKHGFRTEYVGMIRVFHCACGWSTEPAHIGDLTFLGGEMAKVARHARKNGFRCGKNARCQRALSSL